MTESETERSGAQPDRLEGGVSAAKELSTTQSLVVMSLFLVALAGMWAFTYFVLLEA